MTTETITTARMMQRRLRAATRRKSLTASRTRELGQRLCRLRAQGRSGVLAYWLADFRDTIDMDCRWSAK